MKALITGAEGQDGYYLALELKSLGFEIHGSTISMAALPEGRSQMFTVHELDVTDTKAVDALLIELLPDVLFHLAGISSVAFAQDNRELTFDVNVGGLQNILSSIKNHSPHTHLVNACSVEIFAPSEVIQNENSPLGGVNVYAESKQAGFLVVQDARADGLSASNAILSNHESPLRPDNFVTGKIAKGVAEISQGTRQEIVMGNLDVERDWSAAGDIVHGMVLLAQKRINDDVILASGTTTKLKDLVRLAFAAVGIENWQDYVVTDPALVRTEGRVRRLDVSKASRVLDWKASTTPEVWIAEMVHAHLG